MCNAIEVRGTRREIADSAAPDTEERAALEARRDALRASLAASSLEAVRRAISRLFGLLAVAGSDPAAIAAMVTDYADILSEQPPWAISAACRAVIDRGKAFRPSAPEMLAMASNAAAPVRAELAQIEAVLSADVYRTPTPEERERVNAKFVEFAATLATRAETAAT